MKTLYKVYQVFKFLEDVWISALLLHLNAPKDGILMSPIPNKNALNPTCNLFRNFEYLMTYISSFPGQAWKTAPTPLHHHCHRLLQVRLGLKTVFYIKTV